MAFEYAYYLSILRKLTPGLQLTETRAIGGGAQSQVWNQIKADVLDVPYQRLKRAEFATWGSALVAGRAAGLFADLAETASLMAERSGAPVMPRSETQGAYDRLREQYVGWQGTFGEAFRASARSPMHH